MNDDQKTELHDSSQKSKPTHSVVDENDLELCIRNSQQSPRFTFSETGADFVDLNVDEDIQLGNDDNDSTTMAKSSLKRKGGERPSTNIQRGSKASKRSSTDRSTFSGGSMGVSHTVHNIRMEKSTYDPTGEAVKLLEKMNFDDAMFIKVFQWLLESMSNATGFLNISEQHRRLWIQKLLEK